MKGPSNLLQILHFKKKYPENIILLLGNHDTQYINGKSICSGYNSALYSTYSYIFLSNLDLFSIALATATFVESIYGTPIAWETVYAAKWFELLLLIGCINLIFSIVSDNGSRSRN